MRSSRIIQVLEKDTQKLVDYIIFKTNPPLSAVQKAFGGKVLDPMYGRYEITIQNKDIIEQFLNKPLQLNSFSYFFMTRQ